LFNLANGKVLLLAGFHADTQSNDYSRAGDQGPIYLGHDSTGSTRAYLYDDSAPAGSRWSAAADLPVADSECDGDVRSSGKVMVLCANNIQGGTATIYSSGFIYDPLADAWSTTAPMPAEDDPIVQRSTNPSLPHDDTVNVSTLTGGLVTD